MSEQNKLRGLVVSRYGSISKFSRSIGWSGAKTYRLVTGVQEPNAAEIAVLAEALAITDPKELVELFILPWCSRFANS